MKPTERELGTQPLAAVLEEFNLSAQELVTASDEQLTHKQVARAVKGRWLTPAMRNKVRRAIKRACGQDFELEQLFNY